jgi:hypothetical protein
MIFSSVVPFTFALNTSAVIVPATFTVLALVTSEFTVVTLAIAVLIQSRAKIVDTIGLGS